MPLTRIVYKPFDVLTPDDAFDVSGILLLPNAIRDAKFFLMIMGYGSWDQALYEQYYNIEPILP